jgi:CheY-like chemotaxis protein
MAGELVLIVEDHQENLELVRDLLQAHGYRTLETGTAEDGLTLAATHHPDLIVLDIQLPGMDGLEALHQLRSMPDIASTPVVALTAYAMPSDRERLINAGFDGQISKPISIKPFLQMVQEFCATIRRKV